MKKPRRLANMQPAWETGGTSGKAGLSFMCPCPKGRECLRCVLWFANPMRHEDYSKGKTSYVWRTGDGFDDLTVTQQGQHCGDPIRFTGHGEVWIVEGEVWWRPSVPKDDTGGVITPREGTG